jgi:hypothetical protein
MSLIQIIGIVIVLASVVTLLVMFLPVDDYLRRLRDWRQRTDAADALEDAGSLLDEAPRDELDQLAEDPSSHTHKR